jgi:hypothetical protein
MDRPNYAQLFPPAIFTSPTGTAPQRWHAAIQKAKAALTRNGFLNFVATLIVAPLTDAQVASLTEESLRLAYNTPLPGLYAVFDPEEKDELNRLVTRLLGGNETIVGLAMSIEQEAGSFTSYPLAGAALSLCYLNSDDANQHLP